MPRARKKTKSESAGPTPIAETLETSPIAAIIEQAKTPEPVQTEDLLAAFEKQRAREQAVADPAVVDVLAEHLAARRRKSDIEPERPMPEPEKHVADRNIGDMPQPSEVVGEHTAAVLARRPRMQPAPAGFRSGPVFPPAGIRVNRGVERWNLGTAGIQFSDEKPLSRATEYDLMTKLQEAGFQYQAATRQWQRPLPEGMPPGDNTLTAVALAKEIADTRVEGRGR